MKTVFRVLLSTISISLLNHTQAFPQRSDEKELIRKSEKIQSNEFIKLGLSKFDQRDFDLAILNFNMAIRYDSLNWIAYRYKADAERKSANYPAAILSYSKAIELNPNDTISFKHRAECRRISKKCREAIEDYDIAVKLDFKDTRMHFGRAQCNRDQGFYQKALIDLNYCLSLFPNESTYYLQRALVYYSEARYLAAKKDFNRSLELGGVKNEMILYYRGLTFYFLDKIDSAIEDFKIHLRNNENDIDGYTALGLAYASKGDSIASNKCYEKALMLNISDPKVYLSWANAEINLKNYSKAKAILRSEINADRRSSDLYNLLGLAEKGLLDITTALKAFSRAIEMDPSNKVPYQSRIDLVLNNPKYYEIVREDLSSLIRLHSDTMLISQKYAIRGIFNLLLKDTLSAIADANTSVRMGNEEAYPYVIRAMLNTYLKRNSKEIIGDLSIAISLDNSFWQAYILRAEAYADKGDNKKACLDLNNAVRKGAKISEEIKKYLCNVRPENGVRPSIKFTLDPPTERIHDR